MKNVLFLCTGNTCRSPMAACLFEALVKRLGLDGEYAALSAGLSAPEGAPASAGAQRAMRRRGLSLAAHRAQTVTPALLARADCVVGISPSHIALLQRMNPGCSAVLCALDDPPVSDPYGGDDAAYERAARDIERQLPALLHRL